MPKIKICCRLQNDIGNKIIGNIINTSSKQREILSLSDDDSNLNQINDSWNRLLLKFIFNVKKKQIKRNWSAFLFWKKLNTSHRLKIFFSSRDFIFPVPLFFLKFIFGNLNRSQKYWKNQVNQIKFNDIMQSVKKIWF